MLPSRAERGRLRLHGSFIDGAPLGIGSLGRRVVRRTLLLMRRVVLRGGLGMRVMGVPLDTRPRE
jgi:hypothetical protein